MKGLICYHSQSGNTALVCRFLTRKLISMDWDLFEIASSDPPDFQPYDLIGFAAWTYYLGLPPVFERFLHDLPPQNTKPAFLLNTFGIMPGQVLARMERILAPKGFLILAGTSFHTPESYPPYIVKGWHSLEAPTPQELANFDFFCAQLKNGLDQLQAGDAPRAVKIKIDLLSRLIPPYSPAKIRREIGPLMVNPALCNSCGLCQKACLYGAIDSNLPPVFSPGKCQGCWACFNHCPQQAIYTTKIRGQGHYPWPAEILSAKLA